MDARTHARTHSTSLSTDLRMFYPHSHVSTFPRQGGPDPMFTQRATMDADSCEIFVLSGLEKRHSRPDWSEDVVKNSFWVYNIKKRTWYG